MNEREGVIKYEFHHRNGSASFDLTLLDRLLCWRAQMVDLGVLGQDPRRYDGVGFGNVSFRFGDGFVVSGSQTSGLSLHRRRILRWWSDGTFKRIGFGVMANACRHRNP
ncbi:MAG: hypothetical protein R3E66_18500 [bacterium]